VFFFPDILIKGQRLTSNEEMLVQFTKSGIDSDIAHCTLMEPLIMMAASVLLRVNDTWVG
jgi:hypothetical protein